MALSQRALRRATQSAFASVKQVPSIVTLAGWKFAALPDQDHRPYNTTFVSIKGEQWLRLEARQGDNNTNETLVERVGPDGFAGGSLFGINRIGFSIIPGPGCIATRSGEYWNFFELHNRKHPNFSSEFQTRGPARGSQEYSDGSSACFLRFWRNSFSVDPPANSSHVPDVLLYSGPPMVEGQRYDFIVETKQHVSEGYIKIWMNGVQIVDYSGPFGLGPFRPLYPQFRIYRQTRPEPAVAYYKIDEITTTPNDWSPADLGIANLYGWWMAKDSDMIGLNAGNVASWNDRVIGSIVAQATAGFQPALDANDWDGKQCIIFDGADDRLDVTPSPLPTGATPYEAWLLFEDLELGSNGAQGFVVGSGDTALNRRAVYRQPSAGNNRLRASAGDGATEPSVQNTANNLSGRTIARVIWDGANLSVAHNGNTAATVAVVPATAAGRLRFGMSPGSTPTFPAHMNLREVLFTKPLDSTQAADTLAYFNADR